MSPIVDRRVYDPAPRPKTRVAIFGGSFNPPHFAHQSIIAWLLSTGQVDNVWMVPCWRHTFGKRMAPFKHRMAMCQEAARIFSRCSVSDIEKDLGGRSVMLNTIRALKAYPVYQHMEFSLVIGWDNWLVRDRWEGFADLEKECPIIVVGKNDQPRLPDIRSTLIRDMVAAGEDISNLVPRGVAKYIANNGLYGRKPKDG